MRIPPRLSRAVAVAFALALLVLAARPVAWAQQAVAAPSIDSGAILPLDPGIRTGTLPNGLKYFIRRNGRPEKRVSLRLAVKTGSLEEASTWRSTAAPTSSRASS
jgi:zinc protease